jgi:hypothetical protein
MRQGTSHLFETEQNGRFLSRFWDREPAVLRISPSRREGEYATGYSVPVTRGLA